MTAPGAASEATISGSKGANAEAITGGGAAASVELTHRIHLRGTYAFGGLTIGSETLVSNGSATFTSGDLKLGQGSVLSLATLNVLDGQVNVEAGADVTASGAVTLGQPSESGVPTGGATMGSSEEASGQLTVGGGSRFTASGDVALVSGTSVKDNGLPVGPLNVYGANTKAVVGGNLTIGALAVAATATSTFSSTASSATAYVWDGGSLAVAGSVSVYDGGGFYLFDDASFTAKGDLTVDVGSLSDISDVAALTVGDDSMARIANLTAADPTASGQALSLFADSTSSLEIGTKGRAAAGSIVVDAGAAIASTAGLNIEARSILVDGDISESDETLDLGSVFHVSFSIVDNGTISETGGTLDLDAATRGSGSIVLGAKSTLDIGASAAYDVSTAEDVYTPIAVSTAISGFERGDALILDDFSLTKAVYTSIGATTGKLRLYVGSTVEETLLLTGQSYANDTFSISHTANGGSEITLVAPSGSHAA